MINIRGVIEVEGFTDEVVGDPGAHMHATSYIESLSTSVNGYQTCMELLTNGTSCDDRVKFHLLAAIKEYVNDRYADETAEGRERMRLFLSRYIAVQNDSKRYDSAVVRLAAAQIHVIVFEFDYVLHWNDYFDDIVNSAYMGIKTVDHTLRIMDLTSLWLKSSEEVEDKIPDEYREIQLAREFLQINDLPRVMTFLSNVIIEYDPLEVIALRIILDLLTWIDVNSFEDLRIVDIITARLRTIEACEVAVDCFVLMTLRVRTPARKRALVEKAFEVIGSRLQDVAPFVYHAKIGHLHNVMGICLVESHDDAMKSWQHKWSPVLRGMISELFDNVRSFLEQRDYETFLSVTGFTLRYVKLMEKYSCIHKEHIQALFNICIDKMRLELDPNDYPEEVVNGFRDALSEVYKGLTRVDKEAAYRMILAMQTKVLAEGAKAEVNDLELSMYLLQLFCEARNEIAPRQITYELDSLLFHLVAPLVSSDLWSHPHPTIAIRFFKTLSVGAVVLASDSSTLQQVLTRFVSDSCIGHQHCAVRQISTRFLRDMIASLPVRSAIPDSRRMVDKVQTLAATKEALSEDSRLNLHETLAFFVKLGDLTLYERRQLHGEIMTEALVKLHENTIRWNLTQMKQRDELASGVCFAINIVSRSTLAFDNARELNQTGCADHYIGVFHVFYRIPPPMLERGDIRGSMRRLIKRLVFVLDEKFLPCVSDVIQMICRTSCRSYISDDTDMLVYLIDAYTHRLVPTLREEFSMIGDSIYLPIAQDLSKDHCMCESPLKKEFERNYVAYMRAIVRNNMFDQLFRNGAKAHIFGVIFILTSGCYPSLLPHETFQTFAAYLQMETSDILVYLDMITEEVKGLFLNDFGLSF